MFHRSAIIALFAVSFALAGPAFADGKGKGPTHTAPAPLTPQTQTIQHTNNCYSPCGLAGGTSHSIRPVAPAPVYRAPVVQTQAVERIMTIDTSSFTGGVGVGVNDVFVGGGFGNGNFAGSSFGTRSSGAFAFRNAGIQRGFSGVRRSGFRGRSRGFGGRR